jgi:phosphoserine phosphatase RsbU/P
MMPRVREITRWLGKSGISFLVALALFFLFRFTDLGLLAFLDALVLIVLGAILIVRALRVIQRHSLWSVRNRLLFVYSLIGVLPILLLFVLVGLGAWALINELAIYLASSALDRRIDSVQGAVDALHKLPPNSRAAAAPEIAKAFCQTFPGFRLYLRDETGAHKYPPDSPPLQVPPEWKDVQGLLVLDSHFYGWAHYIDSTKEITAVAPLTDAMVENLVPHLGIIALVETPDYEKREHDHSFATAGSLRVTDTTVSPHAGPTRYRSIGRIPPAMNRLDIPVLWPSTVPHFHLDTPNKSYNCVLWVYSRPSAVLRTFFSKAELFRGVLFDIVIGVAILLLLVELVAVIIGTSLARRITRAVNQLYEGTWRVIHGDFEQRITVRAHDQLGELAQSFNQMTGNLERLMAVEKEKERLQTELQIAREVQQQLFPKEAPPARGLKLTVRCDPARMVSGDYYDYEEIAQQKLVFTIGDVAGKGISAALLMATLQASLRAQIAQYQPVRENECTEILQLEAGRLVSQLNKQIYAHTSPEKYATFFFAVFDQKTRTLTYTNAGHLPPLLFRNGDVVPLDSNGTVVGAFPWATYDESCLIMKPGDLLVCYTDGITEPENVYGEMFGEERLIDLVKKHSHEDDQRIIDIVLEAVRGWTGSPELYDDMTLLLAREVHPA